MDEPLAISIQRCAQLLSFTGKRVYCLIKTDAPFPRPFKLGGSTRILLSCDVRAGHSLPRQEQVPPILMSERNISSATAPFINSIQ